jgi:hypothetical protein
MEGLAQSMAGPLQQPQQSQSDTGVAATPEDVVALLMQGIPPEELEKMGVPPEVIMQAIQILEQQMAAEQQQQSAPQPQQGGGGLAQQMAMG